MYFYLPEKKTTIFQCASLRDAGKELKKRNITDEEIRNRTKSDPHSLGRWRVNGALPHVDAWYEAFGIKEGDKMFIPKSERLELW